MATRYGSVGGQGTWSSASYYNLNANQTYHIQSRLYYSFGTPPGAPQNVLNTTFKLIP